MGVRGCAVIFSPSLDLYQRGLFGGKEKKRKKEAARKKSEKESNKVRSNHNLAEQCLNAQFFLLKEI